MICLDDFLIKVGSTRKLYKMTCDKCGLNRGYQRKNRHGLGLCRSCVGSKIHKGKLVSNETKDKMRKSSWIGNHKGHPLLGKKHSDATKAKISVAAASQNKNYLSKHDYNGKNGLIVMKSSWEVKYAVYLDLIGKSWVYEPLFKLSNGYAYLPDFQLSSGDIIEIKGYMREDAQKKWDMFCADYPTLKKSLLRKDDLKKLSLI